MESFSGSVCTANNMAFAVFLFVNSGKSLNVALPGFSDAVGLTVLSKVFCKACSTSLLLYTFPPSQSVLLADCQPADCFSPMNFKRLHLHAQQYLLLIHIGETF